MLLLPMVIWLQIYMNTRYYKNNYLINTINKTTKEKIYLAQKRIDELTKLINYWSTNSSEKQST